MKTRIVAAIAVISLAMALFFGGNSFAAQLFIDTSRSSDGVFESAVIGGEDTRYCLALSKDGVECSYLLRHDGAKEVYPITLGSGWYTATFYENYYGNYYLPVETTGFYVELTDEDIPWLSPSKYVPFTPDSDVAALAEELCKGKETEEEKYKAICGYVRGHFIYDHIKALHTKWNDDTVAPDIDRLLETGLGTCLDMSSAVVAMLRSQGIVSKLVYGYVGNSYHAWTESVVNGEVRRYDPMVDSGGGQHQRTYVKDKEY